MNIGWSAIAPLVVGLLLGWAIEWVIDWVWWRRRGVSRVEFDTLQTQLLKTQGEHDRANASVQRQAAELADLRLRLAAAQAAGEQHKADLGIATKRAEEHHTQLNSLQAEHTRLGAELEQAKLAVTNEHTLVSQHAAEIAGFTSIASTTQQRDPLVDINGIGPVYEDRLYAAGVHTFAQLAEQDHPRLRQIIELKDWQAVDLDAWIAEAREFAQQVQNGTYRKGRS